MVYGNQHTDSSIFAISLNNDREILMKTKADQTDHVFPHYIVPRDSVIRVIRADDMAHPNLGMNKEFRDFLRDRVAIPPESLEISSCFAYERFFQELEGFFAAPIMINIFGATNGNRWRDFFRHAIDSKNEKTASSSFTLRPLVLRDLKNIYRRKYRNRQILQRVSFFEFLKYEGRKMRQGKFNGRRFLIRFFNDGGREELAGRIKKLNIKRIVLGSATISGQVHGNMGWWTSPSIVEVGNITIKAFNLWNRNKKNLLDSTKIDAREICEVESLDDRFIENIRLLEHFEARGTVEHVKIASSQSRLRLFIGRYSSDYIKFV